MLLRNVRAALVLSAALWLPGCAVAQTDVPSAAVTPAPEQSIDRAWQSVSLPPTPTLAPVSVQAATTALLVLDMYPVNCTREKRPYCPSSVAPIRHILDDARAKRMTVIYGAGLVSLNGPTEPVAELAKLAGEPTVRGAADKFVGSNLDELLKAANIETVIVTGTSADGAVLLTASDAALRGYKVVVPVDGMSAADRFAELYTAWHLQNTTSSIARNVTLSRSDLVTIE